MELVQLLEHVATEQGAVGFGVADVAPFDEVRSDMEHRVKEGSHAGLTFTYNNVARSTDVRTSVPWAERLVVLASSYLPEAGSPGPARAGTARIARFATEDHYADTVATMHSMAANLGADTVVLDGLHHWWMFEGAETVADALVAHWDR